MYAVIQSGGKQYRVAPGDVIDVELLGDPGESRSFSFDQVLMVSGDNGPQLGKAIEGATVTMPAMVLATAVPTRSTPRTLKTADSATA